MTLRYKMADQTTIVEKERKDAVAGGSRIYLTSKRSATVVSVGQDLSQFHAKEERSETEHTDRKRRQMRGSCSVR